MVLTIAEVRAVLGQSWSARRVRRWLDRAGVLERRHGTIVVATERLAIEFPEIYQQILTFQDAEDDDE